MGWAAEKEKAGEQACQIKKSVGYGVTGSRRQKFIPRSRKEVKRQGGGVGLVEEISLLGGSGRLESAQK